jgi:archaellin
VSDGINVYNSVATSQSSDGVGQAKLRIGLAPGADPINVTDIEIAAVGPTGTATGEITAAPSGTDATVDSVDATLLDSSDRVDIPLELKTGTTNDRVDLSAAADAGDGDDDGLEPGDEIELTLTTKSGSQTFEVLIAPDPITGSASDL